jgi:hypothetical protein
MPAISLGSTNVTKETLSFIAKAAGANKNRIIVLFDNDQAAFDAFNSEKFQDFKAALIANNCSFSFQQTKDKDVNAAYNNKDAFQKKVVEFYLWIIYHAKNEFYYPVKNEEQLNIVKATIDQAYDDVFFLELNTDMTKFRVIDKF